MELSQEWHPLKNDKLKPEQFTPGSERKVWWLCSRGHEWAATVNNRTGKGNSCPYCSGRIPSKDYSLAVKFPNLVKQWHPTKNKDLTPDQVTPGSGKKVWWKCNSGHEWESRIGHRTNGTGCPYCAGQRATKENNLAVKYPVLSKEWHQT